MAITAANKKLENLRVRKYNGKLSIPCLYNGRGIGHGKYFAAWVDNALVLDENGRPIPYHQLGEVVSAAAPK